jgi:hypothetical protein
MAVAKQIRQRAATLPKATRRRERVEYGAGNPKMTKRG